MQTIPVPANEEARLKKLRAYGIMDTASDRYFDDLTLLASTICETPIALITLIDKERQWFKSKVGVDINETSRDTAFCNHTILQHDLLEVPDLTQDERFESNPFVTNDPHVRFYAGAPLIAEDNCALGSVCVIDTQPRKLNDKQREALSALGRQAVALLNLHRNNIRLGDLSLQKDEFIGIASHDLKNPLQAILGASGLFNMMAPPGTVVTQDIATLFVAVHRNAGLMRRIIEDYLDFQALEDGQLKIQFERVDLNALAQGIVHDQQTYADSKKIRLRGEFASDLGSIGADPARLTQVMNNLVGNAIKFSGSDTEVVVITRREGAGVRFEVRDAGPGLKDEDRAKLFTKYARLSNKPTGNEKSSGLGLSICKSLIELHNGTIGADNNADRGSTFWFQIG